MGMQAPASPPPVPRQRGGNRSWVPAWFKPAGRTAGHSRRAAARSDAGSPGTRRRVAGVEVPRRHHSGLRGGSRAGVLPSVAGGHG